MKTTLYCVGFALLTILLLNSSCTKDEGPGKDPNNPNDTILNDTIPNEPSKVLKFLTIADAKALFISSGNTGKASGQETTTLFKITDDGKIVKVYYLNEEGDTIPDAESPKNIYKLTDDFIIVEFNTIGRFLVNKAQGAVFDANKMPRLSPIEDNIEQDLQGNIYYLGEDGFGMQRDVVKLNISDPENIIVSRYSAAGDQPYRFSVVNSGDMVYHGSNGGRYRYASGGFISNPYGYICSDVNNDSIITCTRHYGQIMGEPLKIQFCLINPQPFGLIHYGDSATAWHFDAPVIISPRLTKMKAKNKIIADFGGGIMEIYNPSRTPVLYNHNYYGFTPYDNLQVLTSSDNYYYILGKVVQGGMPTRLVKVNPDDHLFETVDFSAEYEVYSLNVSHDDVVHIYALRLSDGNRVLAELNSDGTITVLKVLDTEIISTLIQIN